MTVANPNIGHVECPICQAVAAVRKNRAGKLYMDCMHCGRLYPNHAGGQRWLMDSSHIWGAGGPPPTVPRWIAEQWPYVKALRYRDIEPGESCELPRAPVAADPGAPVEPAAGQLGTLPPPPRREPEAEQPTAPAGGFSFLE